MPKTLEKIELFISKHHQLSLATSADNIPQSATLFYAYDNVAVSFIVASDTKTEHIQTKFEVNPKRLLANESLLQQNTRFYCNVYSVENISTSIT